jgi:hypothetical protein
MRRLVSTYALTLFIATLGCDGRSRSTSIKSADLVATAGVTVGQTVGVFSAYWPSRGTTEIGQRMATVANVLLDGSAVVPSVFQAALPGDVQTMRDWGQTTSLGGVSIHTHYFPAQDDLRIENIDVMNDIGTGQDIGESAARAQAGKVLSALGAASVLDATRYDLSRAVLSYRMGGVSPSTSAPVPQIIQYRYLLRRLINGIEFAHNGVLIAIHRSGKIASIRLGGAEVTSAIVDGVEQPVGTGTTFAVQLAPADLDEQFASTFPAARSVKQTLMYVFPAGESSGTVEPREVVRFSLPSVLPSGSTVLSKAQHLAYSLRSPDDPPVYISGVPTPNPEADVQHR